MKPQGAPSIEHAYRDDSSLEDTYKGNKDFPRGIGAPGVDARRGEGGKKKMVTDNRKWKKCPERGFARSRSVVIDGEWTRCTGSAAQ